MANKAVEYLLWSDSFKPGFHGIVKDPEGREGFLSVVEAGSGRGTSFYLIGKGQDPVEVMKYAKQIHDLEASQGNVDLKYLSWLGEQVRALAKDKE